MAHCFFTFFIFFYFLSIHCFSLCFLGGTDGDGKFSPKVLALLFLQGPLGLGAPGGEGGGGGGCGHRNGIRNSLLCPVLLARAPRPALRPLPRFGRADGTHAQP